MESQSYAYALCLWLTAAGLASGAPLAGPALTEANPLPARLSETGLYRPHSLEPVAEAIPFTPQYPLWSDGAAKRRWIRLPPGTAIDASDPDNWQFPVGTRLWKEFAHDRAVETRFIERLADGSWRFAAYVWNAAGSDAELAPAGGIRRHAAPLAPGGRYRIPSQEDCRACHEGGTVPVLGFGALQLSPDRDPMAPHVEAPRPEDVDLRGLVARGLLQGFPAGLLERPPRIAAPSATERAALGYLHGNCGNCHNDAGALADLDLGLLQSVTDPLASVARARASTVGQPSEYRTRGMDQRVVAGAPEASILLERMRSRNPVAQMPPLGSRLGDEEAIALVGHWIRHDLTRKQEISP